MNKSKKYKYFRKNRHSKRRTRKIQRGGVTVDNNSSSQNPEIRIANLENSALQESRNKQKPNDKFPGIIGKAEAYFIDKFTLGSTKNMQAVEEQKRLEELSTVSSETGENIKKQIEYYNSKNNILLERLQHLKYRLPGSGDDSVDHTDITNEISKLENEMRNNTEEIGKLQVVLGANPLEAVVPLTANNGEGMMGTGMMGTGMMGMGMMDSHHDKYGEQTQKPTGQKTSFFSRSPIDPAAAAANAEAKAQAKATADAKAEAKAAAKAKREADAKSSKVEQLKNEEAAGLTRVPSKTLKSRLTNMGKTMGTAFSNAGKTVKVGLSNAAAAARQRFGKGNTSGSPETTATAAATLTPGPAQDIASHPKDIPRPSYAPPPPPSPSSPKVPPPPPPPDSPPPSPSASQVTKRPPLPPPRPRSYSHQSQKSTVGTVSNDAVGENKNDDSILPPRISNQVKEPMDPLFDEIPVKVQSGGNITRKNRQYIHEIKENRKQLFNKEMEIINSIRNFKHGHHHGHGPNEHGKNKAENIEKKFIKVIKRS